MGFFAWKDEYCVGVQEIDVQHRRLFSLADELHAAMSVGKGKAVLDQVLSNLIGYTKSHFAAEERLMQSRGYPNYLAHKIEHDQLTHKVLDLQREFRAGKVALTLDIMKFLRDWLDHHILGSDQKYAPFVGGKAVA